MAIKILVIFAARMSQLPIIIAAPKRVDPRYPSDHAYYATPNLENAEIATIIPKAGIVV